MGLYDSVPVSSNVLSSTSPDELESPFDVIRKEANSRYLNWWNATGRKSEVFGNQPKIR